VILRGGMKRRGREVNGRCYWTVLGIVGLSVVLQLQNFGLPDRFRSNLHVFTSH
jgi:hypothetical protein